MDKQESDKTAKLYTLNDGSRITPQHLSKSDREVQLEAMKRWFYENYEDPVHNCPHISSEGGYQFCLRRSLRGP
jgi:hypothetical protein